MHGYDIYASLVSKCWKMNEGNAKPNSVTDDVHEWAASKRVSAKLSVEENELIREVS